MLLGYVRKLALTPHHMNQTDIDEVVDAGWDDNAIHHAIAVTGRAALMQRLVQGLGLTPLDRKEYAMHAKRRIQLGYAEVFGK
ncbi:hypothetical protein [Pseudomonas sp. S60]|uniref:hypothetical protein n=1 Tax=Pseudomonas sp. S60 TaxID=211124 RepID=UPI0019141A9E|nr:hypothetical protein [Pseudomonas sp. S60]